MKNIGSRFRWVPLAAGLAMMVVGAVAIFVRPAPLSGDASTATRSARDGIPGVDHSDELVRLRNRLKRVEGLLGRDGSSKPSASENAESVQEEEEEPLAPQDVDPIAALARREASFWDAPGHSEWALSTEKVLRSALSTRAGLRSLDCRASSCRVEIAHENSAAVEETADELGANDRLAGTQIDFYWSDKANKQQVIYVSQQSQDTAFLAQLRKMNSKVRWGEETQPRDGN